MQYSTLGPVEAVAFSFEGQDEDPVEEAIQDGGSGRRVAQDFPPVFHGPIRGNERGMSQGK